MGRADFLLDIQSRRELAAAQSTTAGLVMLRVRSELTLAPKAWNAHPQAP